MRSSTPSPTDVAALVVTALLGSTAFAQGAQEPPEAAQPAQPAAPTAPRPLAPPPIATPTPEQVARLEAETAQRDYDLGRFDAAIEHYSRAYEAMPHPALLFNIAQCHRHQRRHRQAAFFYRRYLDLAQSPSNAGLARELLAEMEQKTEEDDAAQVAHAAARSLTEPVNAEPSPVYRRWWFWAAAGVVAAGAAAAIVTASGPPGTTLGTVDGR